MELPVQYRVLDRFVLVVRGHSGYFIGAVPGLDHDSEAREVLAGGSRIDDEIGRALFVSADRATAAN